MSVDGSEVAIDQTSPIKAAAITGDAERSKRAVKAFARHDSLVLSKLYAVHRGEPDAHVSVSNELRDQFARTLREDEAAIKANPDTAQKPA